MPRTLRHVADAIRRAWPRAWTQTGFHERLDAPDRSGSGWLPIRWRGQSHNERLDAAQRKRR